MKVGIMVESNQEFNKIAPINFIAEVLCNVDSYNDLHFSQKRHLKEYGYTEEKFKSFMPLVKLAKHWALITGIPRNYVFDAHKIGQWEELTNICQIIAQ